MAPIHPVKLLLTDDHYRRLAAVAGKQGKTTDNLLTELVERAIDDAAREHKIGADIKDFKVTTIPGPKPRT